EGRRIPQNVTLATGYSLAAIAECSCGIQRQSHSSYQGINMKGMFKTFSWIGLIVGWVVAVVTALALDKIALAFALGIIAICTWTTWGIFLAWLFGVRRHVQRHLRTQLAETTFLVKSL